MESDQLAVVTPVDVQEPAGRERLRRQVEVVRAGGGVTRRVVVGHHHRRCVREDRRPQQVSRRDVHDVCSAAGGYGVADHAVPRNKELQMKLMGKMRSVLMNTLLNWILMRPARSMR